MERHTSIGVAAEDLDTGTVLCVAHGDVVDKHVRNDVCLSRVLESQ